MQVITRSRDMYIGNEDLEHLYTMGRFPIYCGVTDSPETEDQFEDMEWMISKGSGMVQLGKLLPPETLYSISHNSSYGGIWKRHHEEFANFLHQYAGKDGVLEIGGGNGILCSVYNKKYTGGNNWTIIEPSEVEIINGCSAHYIKEMWNGSMDLKGIKYDTLVHSHLMEHQYELDKFMSDCRKVLKMGQRMVFSLPDIKHWLREKHLNTLFFEHTYLISDDYVEGMLGRYGFRILEKRAFGNGHSLFYAVEKTDSIMTDGLDYKKLYHSNKEEFFDFIRFYENKVGQYNEGMKKCEKVYLFGGHIFSQMLINFGLETDRIQCILDNDPLKQGRRLYGASFLVKSPQILCDEDKPVVILNAGAYSEEIKKDIIENINSRTVFWE